MNIHLIIDHLTTSFLYFVMRVDMGQAACKVPRAADYIRKVAERGRNRPEEKNMHSLIHQTNAPRLEQIAMFKFAKLPRQFIDDVLL
ncbi:hypothetical protein ACFSO0_19355 [Brevibacillus sp. GCM10020057]|uniref:hypothetical protein n=1 Tax=Brevibacillus sp. GCM10020057 TaxID=3317327 RepID=UPI00362BB213